MRRHERFPSTMCNKDCCRLKTALDIRRMKLEIKRMEEEEANAKPKHIVETPETALYSFEDAQQMAAYIIQKTELRPRFGIVFGTNMDEMIQLIENPIIIKFTELPNYPLIPIHSYEGKFLVGRIMGGTVIALHPRMHHYDGNPLASCTLPIRIMKMCGAEYLFLTCTTGALNVNYKLGDVVLIRDHINTLNWFGRSPLIGPIDRRLGPRFVHMMDAYDEELLVKALEIGHEIGQDDRIHQGVYLCMGSPVLETPTEQKCLRKLGGDLIGLSIVPEVILARQCDLRVFSFGLVTMPAYEAPATHSNDPQRLLSLGHKVCFELVSRMIYKIQNNL